MKLKFPQFTIRKRKRKRNACADEKTENKSKNNLKYTLAGI
jgi:hypothetical protein